MARSQRPAAWTYVEDGLPENEEQVIVLAPAESPEHPRWFRYPASTRVTMYPASTRVTMTEAIYLAPRKTKSGRHQVDGGFVSPMDGGRFLTNVIAWHPFPLATIAPRRML